ncbi:MAG: SRPBCC family protein [Deltaproteobacteria bacterium]|nr:SRPBCC family protein [Kofleriaceae bacterium]
MALRDLEPVELEWIERAPQVARISEHIEAPPAAVFAAFADAESWTRWFPLMTRAAWLGAERGAGAEREVKLLALGTFRERFLAFEPDRRFAFTVIKSSSRLMTRFGEDYRLTPEGPGTRFDWVMGAEATGLGKRLAPGLRFFMEQLLTRAARNLEKQLTAQRATTYEKPATSSK